MCLISRKPSPDLSKRLLVLSIFQYKYPMNQFCTECIHANRSCLFSDSQVVRMLVTRRVPFLIIPRQQVLVPFNSQPKHCTSASTVAITHVCQPLYQEFNAHMANVHVLPEACGKHRDINGKKLSLRSVNNLQTFRLNAPGESEEV